MKDHKTSTLALCLAVIALAPFIWMSLLQGVAFFQPLPLHYAAEPETIANRIVVSGLEPKLGHVKEAEREKHQLIHDRKLALLADLQGRGHSNVLQNVLTAAGLTTPAPAEFLRALKVEGVMESDSWGTWTTRNGWRDTAFDQMAPEFKETARLTRDSQIVTATDFPSLELEQLVLTRHLEYVRSNASTPLAQRNYTLRSKTRGGFAEGLMPRQVILLHQLHDNPGSTISESTYHEQNPYLEPGEVRLELSGLQDAGLIRPATAHWTRMQAWVGSELDTQIWIEGLLLTLVTSLALRTTAGILGHSLKRLPARILNPLLGLLAVPAFALGFFIPVHQWGFLAPLPGMGLGLLFLVIASRKRHWFRFMLSVGCTAFVLWHAFSTPFIAGQYSLTFTELLAAETHFQTAYPGGWNSIHLPVAGGSIAMILLILAFHRNRARSA